jgi:CheY-like chemotaxis protein
LHGILGLIRLLRERENDPLATRQLDLVRSSGDHLLNVISDVLDFARLEVDGLPVHEQRFNLHALISEMTETAQVTASEKGLSLSHRIDLPSGVDVQGDPIRIRQVLHNLLGNAIKFTSAGSVRLHVARDSGGWVCFQVHDTGIGIPVAEQALVFEAFHQAEGTYQRRFGGTGLGLTISRELARAMGGELSCFSEVDQGSVFTLALPLPSVGDVMRVVHSPAQDKVPHVLLVEDNPVNAMVAEAELQRLGVRVTVIDNGRQAVDWLEAQQPDLVLMDCEMPVMDGIETTRCIRERERVTGRSQVDIVALTANGPDIYAGRCQAVGMSDHLSKPFRPDDLARMLSRHLRLNLMPA